MKSIETRYHGPTNFKGARISATDCGDHRVYVSTGMSEKSGEDLHRGAALALCDKLGWDGSSLIGGATKAGYVFVFPPLPSRDEDDPYPDRVMVDADGKPHYEP